ncbi:MAG: heavy-metal-associated domain-containing protein [Lachnospiraceae bacterium]|nr:heavy-metal-associated domain-containing protein [Lachnospiraceae bacterium]
MNSVITNAIILIALVCIVLFSVKHTISHFLNGGCCGSGNDLVIKPSKIKHVIGTKIIKIDGMHCSSCYRRVQNALNSIDGVNAKIDGKRQLATIKLGRDISDSTLEQAVSDIGYTVVSIKNA